MTINPLKVAGLATSLAGFAIELIKQSIDEKKLDKIVAEKVDKAVAEALKAKGLL